MRPRHRQDVYVTVTGQSSNGVTAITNNTTMVLTVQGGS